MTRERHYRDFPWRSGVRVRQAAPSTIELFLQST